MATAYHNLSDYDFNSVPSAENMRFGIVVSEWNYNITGALLAGAVKKSEDGEQIKSRSLSAPSLLIFDLNICINLSLALITHSPSLFLQSYQLYGCIGA